MNKPCFICFATIGGAVSLLALNTALADSPTGDPAAGKTDFSVCQGCHAVAPGQNGVGPSLAAVMGRQAGTEAGYHYSPAMASSHIDWDAATLDRFLSNPQSVVHGTRMFAAVANAQTRRDIIAYLSTLK